MWNREQNYLQRASTLITCVAPHFTFHRGRLLCRKFSGSSMCHLPLPAFHGVFFEYEFSQM